jgi:hypothetical protein
MSRFNAAATNIAVEQPTNIAVLPTPVAKVAAPQGLRRVSFAKAPKKEETKTEYPVFADPENPGVVKQVLDIAARIKTRSDEIESLEGAQVTDKAELKMFILPFYFKVNQGRAEPPSSVAIPSEAGEVLITFQNRYSKMESEAPLVPLLGDNLEKYFRVAFNLTIKGELLPMDKAQDIVDEIQKVLTRHGALDALEVKEEIKPTRDYHVARHTAFTLEQNLALEDACPIVAMIKTKGRGVK